MDLPSGQLGYSIAQACEVIGCSRPFLYRELKAGHIRATKHGARVFISRQAILEYLGEVPTDLPSERLSYTIDQAWRAMGCSRSFLCREIKAGHLRATKHGAKVLISRQAILEYLGDVPPLTGIAG